METDAFTHVRNLIGEVRRAARTNNLEDARRLSVVAFGAAQAFVATGALTEEDQQQLLTEMTVMTTEFPGLDADEASGVSSRRAAVTVSRGSFTFDKTLDAGAWGTPPARSRRRTVPVRPDVVALGEVELDLRALHLYPDRVEIEVRMDASATDVANWTSSDLDRLSVEMRAIQSQHLDPDEHEAAVAEAVARQQSRLEFAALTEGLRPELRELAWTVLVTDEVGTAYTTERRSGGGGAHHHDSTFEVTPAPPREAEMVHVTFLDHAGDEVARRTVLTAKRDLDIDLDSAD